MSRKSLQLKRPFAKALVVTYSIEKVEGDHRQNLGGLGIGAEMPGWSAPPIELRPDEATSSSYELLRQLKGIKELLPGEYSVRAVYHQSNYGTEAYQTNVITSNEIRFRVAALEIPDADLKINLLKALQTATAEQRPQILEDFLHSYPESIHRVLVLDKLLDTEFRRKNWMGVANACRQLRDEKVSTEWNLLFYQEALALDRAGDTRSAIAVLRQSIFPEARGLERRLEAKLNRMQR